MNNAFKVKTYADSYLYNAKISQKSASSPAERANKEIKDFIISSHRVDRNNAEAFRGFFEDVKRQQTSAVLSSVLMDPRVQLCIGKAPLPRAFGVFEAKDNRTGKPTVFIDLTGRVEFKDGYYIIRRGMIDQICSLLFGALVYLLYRNYQNKLTSNSALTYATTESYTSMFNYILDYLRIYGFAQNKSKVSYAISLFFLTNLMNYTLEDDYAKSVASKVAGLNAREVSAYDIYISDIDFTNINTFVTTLTETFNLKGFDLPSFISKWMYLYGVGTEYATELYTSFLNLICTAYTGSYMVNWSRIESCCTSANLAKIANAVLKAGADSINTKIFIDSADVKANEVHSKSASELAEAMELKNSIDYTKFFVKESEYNNVEVAKESAKSIVDQCKKALITDKINEFAEESIGNGIAVAYNACIDLLEGKVSPEDSLYAIGSLTEVAKVFKNQLTDIQRYHVESTVARDVNHLLEVVQEAEAPKEINKLVANTIMELRDMQKYI